MQYFTKLFALTFLTLMIALSPACSQSNKQAPAKKPGAAPVVPQSSPPPGGGGAIDDKSDDGDDTKDVKRKKTDDDCDDLGLTGFKLLAEPTYDDDIADWIDDNCISCHAKGDSEPILETYAQVKRAADDVLDSIEAGRMPQGGPKLKAAEIKLFEDWMDADFPESEEDLDSDSSSRDDECEEEKDDRDDDDKRTNKDFDDLADELLNPKEKKECEKDDLVYDRTTQECLRASIDTSFECDRSGIIAAFKKKGASVNKRLDEILEDYEIEQCGEYKDEPVVIFVGEPYEKGDKVNIDSQKLCLQDSPACE